MPRFMRHEAEDRVFQFHFVSSSEIPLTIRGNAILNESIEDPLSINHAQVGGNCKKQGRDAMIIGTPEFEDPATTDRPHDLHKGELPRSVF